MRVKFSNSRIDLLALPATQKNALAKIIPAPQPTLPDYYPPGYESISLDRKAPRIKVPHGVPIFFRDRVGRELYKRNGCDFDLNDPYMRNVSYAYDALHDAALERHFKHPETAGLLKQRQILGPNGEAYCSLKDYNNYRRFLYGCHIDRVNKVRCVVEAREQDFCNVRKAIHQSSRGDDATTQRLQTAREQAMIRLIDKEKQRIENFERAEFRRRLAMNRVNAMIRVKSQKVREVMERRRWKHAQNASKIAQRDLHRRIIMKKLATMQEELVEKRKAQVHLKLKSVRTEREREQRDRQFEWREANENYINTLLAIEAETQQKNIAVRRAKIEQHRDAMEREMTMARTKSLGKSYESREVNDVVKKMMHYIKKFFIADYLDQNTKSKRGLAARPTVYELLTQSVVKRAVECCYRNARELQVPVPIQTIICDSVACLRRHANNHGKDRLHQDPVASAFVQREIELIIKNTKSDVMDFLSSNGALQHSNVPTAREKTVRGVTIDDNAIAQIKLEKINRNNDEYVRDELLDIVGCLHTESEPTIKPPNQTKRNVGFGSLPSSPSSVSSMHGMTMRPSEMRAPTPVCSISRMISNSLEKLKTEAPEQPPDHMNTQELIHFYAHQKVALNNNLSRFQNYFHLKLERFCDHFLFGGQSPRVVCCSVEDERLAMATMIKSILTYADEDDRFGENIVQMANIVWSQIIQHIKN